MSEIDVIAAGCQRNDPNPPNATQTTMIQNVDVVLRKKYGTAIPNSATVMKRSRRPMVSTRIPAGRLTTVLMNCRTARRRPI